MNSKMRTHNYQQLNLKNKNKLSKQPEQEQNHRYGDHVEGYQLKGGGGERHLLLRQNLGHNSFWNPQISL